MKLGTETGSLVNHFYSNKKYALPEVGDVATILLWSDRKPATVIAVEKNIITIQMDDYKYVDGSGYGENAKFEYSPNTKNPTYTFRLEKDGTICEVTLNKETCRWRKVSHGYGLRLGVREQYYDMSF